LVKSLFLYKLYLYKMKWYHYTFAALAAMFLVNAIPHLVNGMSGDWLPTPFANPPGKGLSSPTVNVLWAWFNLIVGWLLLRLARISWSNRTALAIMIVAAFAMSLMLAFGLGQKLPS
jgi:hypothetical protein